MTLQDPRRLRRRSRLRIGDIRFTVLGILIAAIPALATVAHAARPLFPNMAHTVGERPIMVATADLDGDGIRDLVVANRWSEDLSILRGLGGGDFGAQQRVPVGAIPVALAIADFNGDGRDDVAAALPVDDKVAVFLTPPSGVPAAPFLLSAGDSPGSVLAVDLDLDGRTDLLAANYFGGVSLWKGLGNGSFQSEKRLASGVSAYSLVVALVNGDLVPDLVVASPGSRQAVVLLGDASGGFGDPAGYSTDALDSVGLPRQIVAADVDLDGAVDFLVGTFDNSEEQNYLVLLRGRGDGSLEPGVLLSRNADGDFSLGAADFNNDGRPDLAFGAHHGFNCCELRNGGIWLGRGDATFSPTSVYRTGVGPAALAIGDLDGNGNLDIAAISDNRWGEVAINLGRGDGTMGQEPEVLERGTAVLAVQVGDLDGDGRLDVATLHEYIAQVHILLGAGSGHFSEPIVLHTGEDPRGFVVRDLDGDGRDDVAVWNRSSDSLSYFRSQGGGGFAPPLPLVQGEQLGGLAAGDVTGDGVADLLVPSMADGGRVMVLSRPGSVGGASLVLPAGTAFPSAVTTGDFDGDGAVDLAVTGEALTVQRGIGPGLFAAPTVVGTGLYLKGLVAGDLDRDGRDDLLTLGDNLEIHAGLADGGFAPPRIIPHNSGPTDLVLADFDADGLPDVVTEDDVDDNSDLSLLLRPLGSAPGVSRRVLVQATAAGGLTAGDLDGDGRLDLLVPSVSGGGVALIRNQGPFPNRPPRALPGAENVLECTGPDGARVTLDGRGSTDPDSTPQQQDLANFEWFEHFGEASQRLLADGAVATVTLPLGEHSLTLRVTDRAGASDAAEFLVDVVDTTAPAAGASMTPARLWPPNHQYTTVRANLAATDRCGPVRVTLVSAKSSEPDDLLGGADGSTRDDIAGAALGTADLEVLLRAERSGLGAGRTYTLTWRVEDGSGNAAEISADVLVPFSQSGGGLGVPPPHGTPGGGTSNGGSHGNGRPGGPKPHPSGRH